MNDPKSTSDIRMIATDIVEQQERLCVAKRDHLEEKLLSLSETVKTNATSIMSLTATVSALAATVSTLPTSVKANSDDITKLKGRPAVWAAIGAAMPTALGVLLWWFNK